MTTPPAAPRRSNPVVQAGWRLSAGFLLLLATFLFVGLLLPGSWRAEATRQVAAPADSVFALLSSLRRWDEWTPWPEIPFTYEGPAAGAGARRSWDAPQIGAGSFTITDAEAPTRVDYQVALDGEDQVTHGSFRLEQTGSGTTVTWSEEGDYGANPVMGWAAQAMKRRHSVELKMRLDSLAAAAERGGRR